MTGTSGHSSHSNINNTFRVMNMTKLFKGSQSCTDFFRTLIFFIVSSLVVNVHADTALIEQGEKVFDEIAGLGCKGCHGEYGEGDLGVGPFIRGASEGSVRAAIEGIGEMVVVKTAISEADIKAVSAYVSSLGSYQVVRTLAKRGRFLPASLNVYPDTNVQLIIKNSSTKPRTFSSDNMDIDPIQVAGRSTNSLKWQAPGQEGTFTLKCDDCKLKDQFFTIEISKTAKQFTPVKVKSKLKDSDQGM